MASKMPKLPNTDQVVTTLRKGVNKVERVLKAADREHEMAYGKKGDKKFFGHYSATGPKTVKNPPVPCSYKEDGFVPKPNGVKGGVSGPKTVKTVV